MARVTCSSHRRSAAALGMMLLLLGCGDDALPPLQTTALTGPPADLRRFEGSWFDPDGNLIALVDNGTEPRLSVRLSTKLILGEASLQEGEVRFRVRFDTDRSKTFSVSLKLANAEELIMLRVREAPPAGKAGWLCGGVYFSSRFDSIFAERLRRGSAPAWFVKRNVREAAEITRRTYDSVWYRLAGIL